MFKRSLNKIFGILISLFVLTYSATTAFADDRLCVDQNTKLNVGDEFTYTLYLSDCVEPVQGIQMYIFYDKQYLEVDPDSLVFNTLDGAMYNAGLDSFLTFNWATPMESYAADYSDRADLISIKFKVLKSGSTEISYFIKQLYGEDNPYLKSYKLTYDIAVNGEVVSTNQTPAVNSEKENINQYQGYFINYVDGMGEDNTPNKENHEAVIGELSSNADKNSDASNNDDADSHGNMTTVIVAVAVIIILIAVAGVLILKNRDEKKKALKTENQEE